MLSALSTPKSLHYFEILPGDLQNCPAGQEVQLEKSEAHSLHLINSQRFAELNSFSLRNFILLPDSDDKPHSLEREHDHAYLSDPLFNVLSLRRGNSECYLEEEDKFNSAHQYFVQEPTALIDIDLLEDTELKSKRFTTHSNLPFLPDNEDSEGDSKTLQTSSNELQCEEKERNSSQTKLSTKNVTKNMGKLLFKYIWKNRISLRKIFAIQSEVWESFVGEIRVWKKENNITRQFLNSRWHSSTTNARIFRMISHHFFRKRCLSAILQSKIECKEMHIKRLRRFQEAISNPSALDNLN